MVIRRMGFEVKHPMRLLLDVKPTCPYGYEVSSLISILKNFCVFKTTEMLYVVDIEDESYTFINIMRIM